MTAPIALGLCAALAWPSVGQNNSTGRATMNRAGMSATDHKFVMDAARGGMAEVKLGELASRQASNSAVKEFGQRMVTDHSKANDELKQLASSKGITLPSDTDKKHKATYARIQKLHGAAFDSAYVKDMLEDHQKDVADFRKEANKGQDPDIKSWAAKTLPTLEEHLTMVKGIRSERMSKTGNAMKSR